MSIVLQIAELEPGADSLAFSADDGLLAVGGETYQVQVWDSADWSRRWSAPHDDWVREVAFSPDGSRLGSVSFDHTARLWDVASGELVAQLDYDYWVYGLDFSSDSQLWATGSLDGKAILADAKGGWPVKEFKHELMVNDLALSPDGPWLATMTTGSYGPGRVIVWDIFTEERRLLAEFQGPAYASLAFSPYTRWLAAGLGSGPIAIWQTQIWPEVARLDAGPGIVNRLIFSPDGRRLGAVVSGGEMDYRIRVWDVPSWRLVSEMKAEDVVWDIAFSPDGRWLVAGLGQGVEHPPANEGQLWNVASASLVARMPHQGQVLRVTFSHDGRRIATGGHDAVKIWELQEE
jgi:WD40 repeat protein